MKNALILGGGFAGLEAAIYLRKANYKVTLVSDRDYFYIYPTSIWIPTRESEFSDVCVDMNELKNAHGFELIIDSVSKIDAKNNTVTLKSGTVLSDYDHLVIGIGASKMKHKGIENTLSICGAPEQSLMIRAKIDELIQKGSGKICFGFGGNPKDTSAVRGGPGFELLFNVHNLLKKKGIRDKFELTFFAPMPEPGKRMGPKALKMMNKFFNMLDINQHFGKKIKMFEKDGIIFEDDSKLESDFTMFIPAGDGHEVAKLSDLPLNEAGFIKTDDYSNVIFKDPAMPTNIYAIGDSVALEGYEWRAKQGHIAEVMAKNVAHNIQEKDNNNTNFKGYHEHLNILCIMDSGDGASFIYRDEKRAFMIPLPVIGHWLKKAWGSYCRYSKLGKIPRIPGM
ncbi:FAD-dependent oxidoreductase [Candidatus Sulfurimonas marisnigri]|uniref:FAD-dependent oxidoreductase n=1 Tax=Candidatus Sulfurimonas marisnigri TaxID=2740405 RepID=A0A7S7M0J8_9BACT|nr:FAD-dependent oxidoreductase [Candidatus Sulfurimonas marisnigri]QOY54819.1 FAD-dependent oxidoreductase [Candidatus Sulfurimonas marisnigri]